MVSLKLIIACFAVVLAVAAAAPTWGHKNHEHVIIHVPYKVHTVHHHHVEKVHVPVPIVKKIYVHHEEPHYISHDDHHDWW